MPVIDGLDYSDGRTPVQDDGDGNIIKRLRAMMLQIDGDSAAYDQCKNYVEGKQDDPYAPTDQRAEIKALRKRSIMNLMPLAVSIPSQLSFVEGYRRNKEKFPEEWNCWLRSGFASRQTSIWSSALTYGAAYVAVENLGVGDPKFKLLSTRNTVAFYEDPINDSHPAYAMTIRHRPRGEQPGRVIYYDPEQIIHYDWTDAGDYVNPQVFKHKLGESPIRRFTCLLDDEGSSRGVVELLIPAQDKVNQSSFDLLATQSFSAFKVRWASGMLGDPVLDENGVPKVDAEGNQIYRPVPIDQSTFLQTDDPQAKFGTLDETPLDGFQASLEQSLRHYAVQAQLPPHSLLGSLSNLSAETLVAAMSQTDRFTHILKNSWGQSLVDLLHLAALDLGLVSSLDEEYDGEVRWRDMSDHTLAAQVDALGKAVQMMGIPERGVWSRFPGVTTGEIEHWEELAEERDRAVYDDPTNVSGSANRESYEPPVGAGIPLGGGDG